MIDEIVDKTDGFSGADLANIINQAALNAVNHNKEIVEPSDI